MDAACVEVCDGVGELITAGYEPAQAAVDVFIARLGTRDVPPVQTVCSARV
jgi:hypothetical protein